jgi:hypothetical protein
MAEWNCSAIDAVVWTATRLGDAPEDGDAAADAGLRAVAPVALLVASTAVLVAGHRIFRPTAVLTAAGAAFAGTYAAGAEMPFLASCVSRLVVSGAAAACAALLVSFLLRKGFFLLGAAAFSFFAHRIYRAAEGTLVPDEWARVGGESVAYWATLAVAALGGGALAHSGRKEVLVVATSVLGGLGVGTAVGMLWAEGREEEGEGQAWLPLVLGGVAAAAGGTVQLRSLRRRTGRTSGRQEDEEEEEGRQGTRRRRKEGRQGTERTTKRAAEVKRAAERATKAVVDP